MKRIISLFGVLLILSTCFGINSQALGVDYALDVDYTQDVEYALDAMALDYNISLNAVGDSAQLGSLSAKYESNGNPATISEGKDTGGVSYGAYQFSSSYGVPIDFAEWCIGSGANASVGNRLKAAFKADGNRYGVTFNAEWKAIAQESPSTFLQLQHDYTKVCYYDKMVARLEKNVPGFDVDNYTIALKNVIWSRAVQSGANSDVIEKAFESLGGFNNQPEDVLIKAIYARASLLVDFPPEFSAKSITRESAEKYGIDPAVVEGKYLYYFCRNTSDVQVAVYKRLAISERNEALNMYVAAGGTLTPGEPTYQTPDVGFGTSSNIFVVIAELFISFVEIILEFIMSIAA